MQAKAVFFGDNGTLAGVSEGKQLVDCATLDAATMQQMSEAAKAKGGLFLEAPVSGSKVPAEQVRPPDDARLFRTLSYARRNRARW